MRLCGLPAGSTYEKCLPAGYNPYAYENMVCDEWVYTDGSNPRYLEGFCLSNMINVSGGTIVACDNGSGGMTARQPSPGTAGRYQVRMAFPKVTEWVQTEENLDDQILGEPLRRGQGTPRLHRRRLLMMMYAWSPNWQANSVGNDHYNLYARRSFDGGLTWTTTPGRLWVATGTETCENY